MSLTKYNPVTRLKEESVLLHTNQFARWLSRRKGVSSQAVSTALRIIGEGILEALAEGYDFQWKTLGTFETRELKPRRRYHRIKGEVYMCGASLMVHFKKAPNLSRKVKAMADAKLEQLIDTPAVKPVEKKS